MQNFPIAVATLLLSTSPAFAADWPITRIAFTDSSLQELLADGYSRSATLRRIVNEIEASHWTVFVIAGNCPNKHAIGCLLHTVGTFEGRPYLRIVAELKGRHPDVVLSTIAHELQHALEAITSGEVRDTGSIEALFRRIGTKASAGGGVLYETTAAQKAGEQVLRELQNGSSGPAAQLTVRSGDQDVRRELELSVRRELHAGAAKVTIR